MKSYYLFPSRWKKIGWIVFVPACLMGLVWIFLGEDAIVFKTKVLALAVDEISFGDDSVSGFFEIVKNNVVDEIIGILIIVGGLLVAFSKEEKEDELISKLRLESLVWATYINYIILVLAIILVYGISFYWIFIFNMFTILIIFIARFNFLLHKLKKANRHAE